jgi:hypothetical protein
MVRVYTAFTKEIDDRELAVQEILEQLNPKENALANTIGIFHFYHEFVETEVCQAIINALPFETVGCVSSYIGTRGLHGDVALSVSMITGDDIRFAIKTGENVSTKSRTEITDEIIRICNDFSADEKPKMVIPFIPPLQDFSGDELVAAANAVPDPVAMFGTLAFNMENMAGPHYVLGNGKISSDMMVFIAFYGNFIPKLRINSSFDLDESFGDTAKITEADGPILKTINGINALEYLKKQGMITSDNAVEGAGIWAIPAILTYPNGVRVIRAFLGIVEGTEYIYSTGAMDAGAKIKFAYLDKGKTLASAEKMFKEICDAKENGVLAFSCAARSWALGTMYYAEAQKIAECAEEYKQKHDMPLNYCVAYSGGEISPVIDNDGKLVNTLHNYTLISCSFI